MFIFEPKFSLRRFGLGLFFQNEFSRSWNRWSAFNFYIVLFFFEFRFRIESKKLRY